MAEAPPPPGPLQSVEFNPFPNRNMTCRDMVDANSVGLWDLSQFSDFLRYPLTRLQLQLALIFSLTQSLHLLLRRFHLPRITSELLAGLILGPTICGHIPNFADALFPLEGDLYLDTLSKIGFTFFMFLSGVKMNPRLLFNSGASTSAWTVGTIAPIIPFLSTIRLLESFVKPMVGEYRFGVASYIIAVQNRFSFPVIFSLLKDLKIMNSELGRLALTSALISDLVSGILLAANANIQMGYVGWKNWIFVSNIILTNVAVLIIVLPSMPSSRWIIAQTREGRPFHRAYVTVLCAAVLFSSIITDNVGLFYHHGPFILGLALPDGPPIGSTLANKLEPIICGLYAPLLVTICGLRANLLELYDLEYIRTIIGVMICSLLVKLAATFSPALICKMPVRDAFALACIMSTQGIEQMFLYSMASFNQSIDGDIFSVSVFSLLLIASGMQLCVHSVYDHSRTYAGYQKRDIQNIAYNAELRVLVTSSRTDDALAIIKILEASYANSELPLTVYSLSLVELVGRAHPLIIDHQLGQKTSIVGPHVQKILEIFQSFREQYMGMVSVYTYTAMSLPKFMHDDVCSLAFDKMASLIILPFHVKWNYQGKMIADSVSVRAMNCHVLDMAPCSVGILVDRHRIKSSSDPSLTYNVAIVFLGGNDDREALAYGKRMARSPGIHLTVVRFVPWDPEIQNHWDTVLDSELLKELRLYSAHQDNIVYTEEKVKDGGETALQLRAMEEQFDLILVGRRHREDSPQLLGLNEWNVYQEMGPIGDIFASLEIMKPVSVLVIQQQILRIK